MATKEEIRELYRLHYGGVPPSVERQLAGMQEDGRGIHTFDYSALIEDAPVHHLDVHEVLDWIIDGIQQEYMDIGRTMYRIMDLRQRVHVKGDLPGGA